MKKYLIILISVFCGINTLVAQQSLALNTTSMDVLYKVKSNGDSLKLDVFMPSAVKPNSKAPVLVMIHGGAWVAGDRSLEREYYKKTLRDELTNNGIAVVSISYTLVHDSLHFPLPLEDCKDALRWLRTNADTYNLDTCNVGLWGESAGAHLALMTAYAGETMWQGTNDPIDPPLSVSYVIDNFGPTNLNTLLQTEAGWFKLFMAKIFMRKLLPLRERLAVAITGYSLQTHKDDVMRSAETYSPIPYVTSSAVPTLIFHGTKDPIVPIKESKELQGVLEAKGVENELIVVEGGDHGFRNISDERVDELVKKTLDFITERIKPSSSL